MESGISENATPAIQKKTQKKGLLNWEFQEIAVVSPKSFLVRLLAPATRRLGFRSLLDDFYILYNIYICTHTHTHTTKVHETPQSKKRQWVQR